MSELSKIGENIVVYCRECENKFTFLCERRLLKEQLLLLGWSDSGKCPACSKKKFVPWSYERASEEYASSRRSRCSNCARNTDNGYQGDYNWCEVCNPYTFHDSFVKK